jgi:hypothetical protein
MNGRRGALAGLMPKLSFLAELPLSKCNGTDEEGGSLYSEVAPFGAV